MTKHPHHTLLPIHLQNALMSAATSGRMEFLDRTIRDVYDAIPQKFHTERTVSERRFVNEPRQLLPNAGSTMPFPLDISRS